MEIVGPRSSTAEMAESSCPGLLAAGMVVSPALDAFAEVKPHPGGVLSLSLVVL